MMAALCRVEREKGWKTFIDGNMQNDWKSDIYKG